MSDKIFKNNIYRLQSEFTTFYELQFCDKILPVRKLKNYKNIAFWKEDSLYIEDMPDSEIFYNNYDSIFGQFGKLDYYGINYFTKEQTVKIFGDLENKCLPDIETLLNWLDLCIKKYNGFYFLGI